MAYLITAHVEQRLQQPTKIVKYTQSRMSTCMQRFGIIFQILSNGFNSHLVDASVKSFDNRTR